MDNEYLLQKIIQLLKDRENNLFTGTITNPRLFSECNVTRDNDNLSITAINLNCISPGKVIVIKDIDDNKYYCFSEIQNNVISTNNIHYRKTNNLNKDKINYYTEVIDLGGKLTNKTIFIGGKKIKLDKLIVNIKRLKDNTKSTLIENLSIIDTLYGLKEHKNFLVSYSDSCNTLTQNINGVEVQNNKKYNVFVNTTTNKFKKESDISLQPNTTITKHTEFSITNFTPMILYSFISNLNTKPTTNLSTYFNAPISKLKRNKAKYNPNFYLIWRLIESGTGYLTYAYGWINLDGQLKVSSYNYKLDGASHLDTNYIFHTGNQYDGFMRIDIGGLDRTNLIVNRENTLYKPFILFPPTTNQSMAIGMGNTDLMDDDLVLNKINNDIYDPLN